MNNLISQALTSLEVAEMVEKDHKQLLKDIRRYSSQLAEGKIAPGSFWAETTYKDANGQDRPCYHVTKMGCEFIAHKLTGVKGAIFTAKYIERFHAMEEEIRQPKIPMTATEQIKLLAQGNVELNQKVDNLEERFTRFEMDLPLLPDEADEIHDTLNKRVVYLLGGGQSNAYANKSLTRKVFMDAYRELKRNFNVSRYKAIKRNQKERALEIVTQYKPPYFLDEEIRNENAQQKLDV